MTANGLEKLYDKLTPEERFKLHVKALGRGDLEDAARLRQTCPMKPYRIGDPAFFDRLDASRLVALAAALDLAVILTRLKFIVGLRELVPALIGRVEDAAYDAWREGGRWAWQAAGQKGEPPWPEEDPELEPDEKLAFFLRAMNKTCKALADQAKTIWAAFDRFCNERLGTDGRSLLQAYFSLVVEQWEASASVLEDGEADPAGVDHAAGLLAEIWEREAGVTG